MCVLILLYVCPHTIYVSSYYYVCPHTTMYVSSYCIGLVYLQLNKKKAKAEGTVLLVLFFFQEAKAWHSAIALVSEETGPRWRCSSLCWPQPQPSPLLRHTPYATCPMPLHLPCLVPQTLSLHPQYHHTPTDTRKLPPSRSRSTRALSIL